MSRAVLIGSTSVGQFTFLADSNWPGWQLRLAALVRQVPAREPIHWDVIPIPAGHGPRKVVTP